MASRKLSDYERKRSFEKTPEPRGGKKSKRPKKAKGNRFVVHEHHARRLHWDLRLERDGVLASWALPKGVPQDPKGNRLAVRTEDHPLEYLDFRGEIPKGEYGAGTIEIWDRGTYEAEKFRDDEVILTFTGERVKGKYALFQTKGDNWMIHRMDPPLDPEREPMPKQLKPMLATLSTRLPRDEEAWAYEVKWDGVRAIAYSEAGRLRLESRNLREITSHYPELRALGGELGAREAVFDGEVVAFGEDGRPSFERLQSRMNLASESAVRRRMADCPVTYLIFDLLFLDGRSLVDLPYAERRERLEGLKLDGPSWQTPSHHRGEGKALRDLTKERGLEGLVAKRLDSRYLPGAAQPGLAEGEEHPQPGARDRRLAPRAGAPSGDDRRHPRRLPRGRRRRAAAALRRPGRQRLHRSGAAAPRRPARAPPDIREPLRGPPAAEAGRVRGAPFGGRDRLPRMDGGPNPARPRVQGAANRQGPGGGGPGAGGGPARTHVGRAPALLGENGPVKVSAKTDYAVRAMIELAGATEERPVSGEQIAGAQEIPLRFLGPILTELRYAGLVRGRRGRTGATGSARPPGELTLAEIISELDGPLASVRGEPPEELTFPGDAKPLREVWIALGASMREVLEAVTVADVAGQAPRAGPQGRQRSGAWRLASCHLRASGMAWTRIPAERWLAR